MRPLALAVAGLAATAALAAPAAAAPPEPCGDLYVGTCFVHGEDGGYTCLAYVNQAGVEYCLFEHRP